MARKVVHVVPNKDGAWNVKTEGASRAGSTHAKKSDAVDRAKEQAKAAPTGQVKIHGKDGKIQTEHTYGKDPCPPKG